MLINRIFLYRIAEPQNLNSPPSHSFSFCGKSPSRAVCSRSSLVRAPPQQARQAGDCAGLPRYHTVVQSNRVLCQAAPRVLDAGQMQFTQSLVPTRPRKMCCSMPSLVKSSGNKQQDKAQKQWPYLKHAFGLRHDGVLQSEES